MPPFPWMACVTAAGWPEQRAARSCSSGWARPVKVGYALAAAGRVQELLAARVFVALLELDPCAGGQQRWQRAITHADRQQAVAVPVGFQMVGRLPLRFAPFRVE